MKVSDLHIENQTNSLLEGGENVRMELQDASFFRRKRYLVTVLVFFGWAILFMLRTNLSIGLVDMTSDRVVKIGNESIARVAEFNWTSFEKGMILSSFSWGYVLAPVGAFVSSRVGPAVSFGAGIGLTGLSTVLTPFLIKWNLIVFLVVRFMEGIFEGVAASSSAEIFAHWSTLSDRFVLTSVINSGALAGAMLSYPISGTVAYYLDWRAVFHVTGGISLVWLVIWSALVRNTPAHDTLMSNQERMYLQHINRNISMEKIVHPWKQILQSKVVWAYVNERFMEGWCSSFLTYSLPIFIKDVHDVNIQDIGFISGIPHFCGFFGVIGGTIAADFMKNRKMMSVTVLLKSYFVFAQTLAAILLVTSALWMNFTANTVCFSTYRLIFSVATAYYNVLPVLVGGGYACSIMSLGIMALAGGYALSPLVMGLIVQSRSSSEWSRYFILLSLFNVWGGIIFYTYGSGDLQPWASTATTKVYGKNERG